MAIEYPYILVQDLERGRRLFCCRLCATGWFSVTVKRRLNASFDTRDDEDEKVTSLDNLWMDTGNGNIADFEQWKLERQATIKAETKSAIHENRAEESQHRDSPKKSKDRTRRTRSRSSRR